LGAAILVVDDDRDNATSLELLLRSAGYSVAAAYGAASALEVARQSPPRLVFIDLAMPLMDGFALARQLRQLPSMAHSCLVCLTGYSGADFQRQAQEAGYDHYMIKPGAPDEILRLAQKMATVDGPTDGRPVASLDGSPASPPGA
jgi:CheY-like chemotaxis protein